MFVTAQLWNGFPGVPGAKANYLDATVPYSGTPTAFSLPASESGMALTTPTVRSLFHCQATDAINDNLKVKLQEAAVNCLEFQVFPGETNLATTLAQHQAKFNSQVKPWIDWCAANGIGFLGLADGLLRFESNQAWVEGSPVSAACIASDAAHLQACGVCRGIETVDEVGPNNTGTYDPAAMIFVDAFRSVCDCPISWPGHDTVNWDVPERASAATHYTQEAELTSWKYGRRSLSSYRRSVRIACQRDINPILPLGFPVGITRAFYQKKVPGGEYQEGDEIISFGQRPEDVVAQVWLAAAWGCSRFRCYGYDWALWRLERLNWPAGTIHPAGLQSGSKPGDELWAALGAAFNAVANREPQLVGTPYFPVQADPWVFGRRGSLVWGVNIAERPLPSPNGPGTVLTPSGEQLSSTVPGGGVILWLLSGLNYVPG